jgi:8-oxo-dGTP pyrophosphatase MutT (NUDIX family)
LHCTRKKKKGPHFQLPGGHIDEFEFFAAAEQSSDSQTQLLLAARAGAARELYEETGLDVRNQLDRLEPAALRNDVEVDKHGKEILKNELKHRLYFFLPVTDDDFWSSVRIRLLKLIVTALFVPLNYLCLSNRRIRGIVKLERCTPWEQR